MTSIRTNATATPAEQCHACTRQPVGRLVLKNISDSRYGDQYVDLCDECYWRAMTNLDYLNGLFAVDLEDVSDFGVVFRRFERQEPATTQ